MSVQETKDYEKYIEAWRNRLARREAERRKRAKQLREVAYACAQRLVQDFRANGVYLFGSLLQEDWVHDRSDIDLAVEGLEDTLYFKALRELGDLLPAGAELDLVPLEKARPGLAERVRMEGVLLDANK